MEIRGCIKVYSLPEANLLQILSQTLAACTLTDELLAVRINRITTVVAMVLRRLTIRDGEESEYFCALSQPGLEASVLRAAYDICEDEYDENGGDIE